MYANFVDFNAISTFVDSVFNYIFITVSTFKSILSNYNSLFCRQSFIFDFKRFITVNGVGDEIAEPFASPRREKMKLNRIK